MKTLHIYPVVIAGGKGERFWPKSRRFRPKQFLRLFGRTSLLQETHRRISRLAPSSCHRYVIPEAYLNLLFKEIKIHPNNILIEPEGKNTFPAICLAAIHLPPDGTMVVLPSDHLIGQESNFYSAINFATELAKRGYLVTFGIEPTRIETGYGYIEIGEEVLERKAKNGASNVKEPLFAFTALSFKEKPDLNRAKEYVKSGHYLWNSGIFVWQVKTFLQGVNLFYPNFFSALLKYQKSIGTKEEKEARKELYQKAPNISVDYAIMEKAKKVVVVKSNFQWDDVGGWLALERHFGKDHSGNVRIGSSFIMETEDSILYTEDSPIFAFGLNNLLVVKTKDLIFLCPKEKANEIKRFLSYLFSDPKGKRFL